MILTVTLNPAVDLVVFGDRFAIGETNRGEEIAPDAGGKGNNVARIARALGCEVASTGIIGGFTGEYVRAQLESEAIRTEFYETRKTTRITVSYVESGSLRQTKIVPDGPARDASETTAFTQHFRSLLERNHYSIVSLNGSLPRGIETSYYSALVTICREHGVPVVLDTSSDALSESVRGIESGSGGKKALPDIIKPNLLEAQTLLGLTRQSTSDEEELRVVTSGLKKLNVDVPLIALTLGEEGAILFDRGKLHHGVIRNANAVNPICAGDAFVGGFMAAYDQFPESTLECFRWAVAAGTATASVEGLLWERQAFDRFLRRVEVQQWP